MFAGEFKHGAELGQPAEKRRYSQVRAGPARTLHSAVAALQRGDEAVVLTGQSRSARRAIVTEIARLAGREYARIENLSGQEAGTGFSARLTALGLNEALAVPLAGPWQQNYGRTLLMVEDADLMPDGLLNSLAGLRDNRSGRRVQLFLAGSARLLVTLCQPASARLWNKVRLTLMLDEQPKRGTAEELTALRAEIARTEARLAAQRRILSIFAEDAPPTPLGEP